MAVPKSVIKINKDGVQYVSSCDKAQYFIKELTKAALRDVGKFVIKSFKNSFYEHFKEKFGDAGRSTKYNVICNDKTKFPRVEVGLRMSKPKKSKNNGFYAYFQEFGSSKTQKLGLLHNAVMDNIPEIIKIESQYLSALEDEAKVLSLIDEKEEYSGGADGEE